MTQQQTVSPQLLRDIQSLRGMMRDKVDELVFIINKQLIKRAGETGFLGGSTVLFDQMDRIDEDDEAELVGRFKEAGWDAYFFRHETDGKFSYEFAVYSH